MKRNLTILSMIITLMGLIACESENELDLYQNDPRLYIYKDRYDPNKDSIIYTFTDKPSTLKYDTVWVSVRIMGNAESKAREIKLTRVDTASTAIENTHYKLLNYSMPADSFAAKLPVLIYRSGDLDSTDVRLRLRIVETADFKPGVINQLDYIIHVNNILLKPIIWDKSLRSFFGNYSKRKHAFMIDVLKTTDWTKFGNSNGPAYGMMLLYKQKLSAALAEYVAANGNMIDENKEVVTFPK